VYSLALQYLTEQKNYETGNLMYKTKLAERVIELCPDLMGMARTSEQLLSDPRTVQSLVDLVEEYIGVCKEWEAHCEVLVDQRDWNTGNNERLRDALYEIAHMDPIRRIQGQAQIVAKRALEIK
jgi:hypothetical protein